MAPLLLVAPSFTPLRSPPETAAPPMAMHLFSTPIQCPHCGTVVDNPVTDKCPNCGRLLKERRTPSRLAGVERRYGQLRLLLATMRFLGVVVLAIGALLFLFGDDTLAVRLGSLLGGVLVVVGMFVVAAFIEIMLDVEENTRASFRLQQQILEAVEKDTEAP